jgi:hypothetical protein
MSHILIVSLTTIDQIAPYNNGLILLFEQLQAMCGNLFVKNKPIFQRIGYFKKEHEEFKA